MYSLTGRVNYFGYSGMICLLVCAALNHLLSRFGHMVSPDLGWEVKLDSTDISFQLNKVEYFAHDKNYYDEDALSFTFDMVADLTKLYTWNTNMVLASLVCEFEGDSSVTVWD